MVSYFNQKGTLLTKEDSLTSTVIDLLKYLPDKLFLQILSNSLYNDDKLKIDGQEVLSVNYWVKWTAEFPQNIQDNLPPKNIEYVEPDVFIELTDYDIIIEAKRWDRKGQDIDQVKREILAYLKENETDSVKPLYLIQLGGLNTLGKESYYDTPIYKTDWSMILSEIVSTSKKLKNTKNSIYNRAPQIQRVLDDLIIGLSLHRFMQLEWLESFQIRNPLDIKSVNAKKMFSYASK